MTYPRVECKNEDCVHNSDGLCCRHLIVIGKLRDCEDYETVEDEEEV
jgi:hypothetical protein